MECICKCGRTCKSPAGFKSHRKACKVAQEEDKKNTCECGKICKSAGGLKIHKKSCKKPVTQNVNKDRIIGNKIAGENYIKELYATTKYSILKCSAQYIIENSVYADKEPLKDKVNFNAMKEFIESQRKNVTAGFMTYVDPIIMYCSDDGDFVTVDGDMRLWSIKHILESAEEDFDFDIIIYDYHGYTYSEISDLHAKIHKIVESNKVQVPKRIREDLWKGEFGDSITGKCFCCKSPVKNTEFEAGHVISKALGGTNNLSNLRVLCKICNSDMGTCNMYDYIKRFI